MNALPEVLQSFDLRGRVALVTGGTKGLGDYLSRTLAQCGAFVYATTRHQDDADAFTVAAKQRDLPMRGIVLDVTDEDQLRATQQTILTEQHRFDILINNAVARCPVTFVEETRAEDWAEQLAVNVTGAFLCSKVFAESMQSQGKGVILNIGSIYGSVAVDQRVYGPHKMHTTVVYAASKAALVNMTQYLAAHWAKSGIRVNCLSPGGVRADQPEFFLEQYQARVPMGRMAQTEEVGGATLYLVSDASSYVTGQNLLVDGGWTIW